MLFTLLNAVKDKFKCKQIYGIVDVDNVLFVCRCTKLKIQLRWSFFPHWIWSVAVQPCYKRAKIFFFFQVWFCQLTCVCSKNIFNSSSTFLLSRILIVNSFHENSMSPPACQTIISYRSYKRILTKMISLFIISLSSFRQLAVQSIVQTQGWLPSETR